MVLVVCGERRNKRSNRYDETNPDDSITFNSEAVLVWNYPDVLQLIDKHSCVVAVISGHDHEGGYNISSREQDSTGNRYRSL